MSDCLQGLPLQGDDPTLTQPGQALPQKYVGILSIHWPNTLLWQMLLGLQEHCLCIQDARQRSLRSCQHCQRLTQRGGPRVLI